MTGQGPNDALARWLLDQYPSRELLSSDGATQGMWLTPPARLSFPSLGTPRKMEGSSQEPKYEATLLFPVGADDYLKVLSTAWQATASNYFKSTKGLESPLRNQDEKLQYAGYEQGARFISVSSHYKPQLFDEQRRLMGADDPRIYPGVWVRAKVRCYTWNKQSRGVKFGLVSLQRLADDKPFGNVIDPAEGLDDVKAVPEHLRVSTSAGGDFDSSAPPPDTPSNGFDKRFDDEIPF